ncbi:DNA-binding response regulator [Devosia insulae DS-56]|uniref:Regulatory protein VirG n=1 Tax=Devosia insulae DS-56 TaxID=1116389 RepID=A0A1E5XIC5_9HYPH|nr:response regulator transcription factor [Devosia insulae]OEO28343.1 DNA-binding response regulator [Devosia insulae DS-56]
MTASPHVLVVDDDQEIRKLLGRYLGEQGFRVSLAGSKREFLDRVATERLDIVVLDVLLPDGSGLDLCRYLRQRAPQVPVILVTALKEEVDRIIGLEIGADDYLGKPFNPRELVARMRAVLRRAGGGAVTASGTTYRFAALLADAGSRSVVTADGAPIDLTGAEFELLRVFLDRPGRVLSREQLLGHTQGREAGPLDRSIDVLMSRLRRKLGAETREPLFKTVRNGGYQLVARVEAEEAD